MALTRSGRTFAIGVGCGLATLFLLMAVLPLALHEYFHVETRGAGVPGRAGEAARYRMNRLREPTTPGSAQLAAEAEVSLYPA